MRRDFLVSFDDFLCRPYGRRVVPVSINFRCGPRPPKPIVDMSFEFPQRKMDEISRETRNRLLSVSQTVIICYGRK
jgi:hypothetical protein